MHAIVKFMGTRLGYKVFDKKCLHWGINQVDDLDSLLDRKSVEVVFDIGANIGQSMEWMLKAFPQAKIHCFEPVAVSHQKLRLAAQSYSRVVCHEMALGAEDTVATMYTDADDKVSARNSFVYCSDENVAQQTQEKVTLGSLDTFCIREKIDQLRLLSSMWKAMNSR